MTPEELKALRLDIQQDPENDINTVPEFAAALGLTGKYGKRTIHRWESGQSPIQGPALVLLAEWARSGKPVPRANPS